MSPDGSGDSRERVPPYASDRFLQLLEERNLAILDIRAGVASGTRRLLLGRPGGSKVAWVVAVGPGIGPESPALNEERVLTRAHEVLSAQLRQTIPRVQEHVEVYTSLDGLLLTAVPGISVGPRRRTARRTRDLLLALPGWLHGVWDASASGTAPVELGSVNVRAALERIGPIPRLETALEGVQRARLRLDEHLTPRTLTHGCLCLDHVFLTEGALGVEDWSGGSTAGDPLRDVARFSLDVAGGRLPEVLAGRSGFAAEVRHFMSSTLATLSVPPQLWQEVLVLAQLELAVQALERDDPNPLHLLVRAVRLSGTSTRRPG